MKNHINSHSLLAFLDNWFELLTRNSRVESFQLHDNIQSTNLFVKRDDLIHASISGNKLRKLKYNLTKGLMENCIGFITYGGAYSNHLLAMAAAGHELGIPVIGMVRGDELHFDSNPILQKCHQLGMELKFLSRHDFSKKKQLTGKYELNGEFYWLIPEGGANIYGIQGCKEIVGEMEIDFDYYLVAQGTTTTSLGLLCSIPERAKLIVIPVLKGFDVIKEMRSLLNDDDLFDSLESKLIIWDSYHHGGYAKSSPELTSFIEIVNQKNSFQVEPVYTGKVLFALHDQLTKSGINSVFRAKNMLVLHTGGV